MAFAPPQPPPSGTRNHGRSGQRAYGEYLTAAEQAIQYGHSANKVGHTEEALQHFQKAHQMQVTWLKGMSKTLSEQHPHPPQPLERRPRSTPPPSAAMPLSERTALNVAHQQQSSNLFHLGHGKANGGPISTSCPGEHQAQPQSRSDLPSQPHMPSYLRPTISSSSTALSNPAPALSPTSSTRRTVRVKLHSTYTLQRATGPSDNKENGYQPKGWSVPAKPNDPSGRSTATRRPFSSSNGGRPFEATPPVPPLFDDGRPLMPPSAYTFGTPAPSAATVHQPQQHAQQQQHTPAHSQPQPQLQPPSLAPHDTWVKPNASGYYDNQTHAQPHDHTSMSQQYSSVPLSASLPRSNPYTESLRKLEEYTARQSPYTALYNNLPQPPPPPSGAGYVGGTRHGGPVPYRSDEDLYRESVRRLDEMRTRLTNSLWRKEMQLKSVSDACTDPNCDPLESPLAQELTRARAGLPPSPPNDGASDPADATPKPTLFSRTTRFEGASSARIPAPTRTPNSGEAKDESNGSKPEVGATDGSLGKGARTKETPAKQRRQGRGRFTPGGSKNALWSPVPKTRMEKDLKERLKEQEEAVEEKDMLVQILMKQLESHGDKGITEVVSLGEAQQKLKDALAKLMAGDEADFDEAQAEFDKWDKFIRNHPEHIAAMEEEVKAWVATNEPHNQAALRLMRSYLPPNIWNSERAELDRSLSSAGLPPALVKRVWEKKVLWLLRAEPGFIARIHAADLNLKYTIQGLDLTEVRAVYACLPDKFENDSDDRKEEWRAKCLSRLKEMASQQEKGTLPKSQKRNSAYDAPAALKVSTPTVEDDAVLVTGSGSSADQESLAQDAEGGAKGGVASSSAGGSIPGEEATSTGPFDPDAPFVNFETHTGNAFEINDLDAIKDLCSKEGGVSARRVSMPELDTMFGGSLAQKNGAEGEEGADVEKVEKPQVARLRRSTRDMSQAPSLQTSMMAELSKSLRMRNAKAAGINEEGGEASNSENESIEEKAPRRKLVERPSHASGTPEDERGGGGGTPTNPMMAELARRFGKTRKELDDGEEMDAAPAQEERVQRPKPSKLPEQGGGNPFLAELSRRSQPAVEPGE